jgi:hypothetical protein
VALRICQKVFEPTFGVMAHFRITHQPDRSSFRPPVQLQIADAILENGKLIGALMLPVAWDLELAHQRFQFIQAAVELHGLDPFVRAYWLLI